MKHLTIVLAIWGLTGMAAANDSGMTGAGGRWRRLGGESGSVQMVSEKIHMDLDRDDSYTTTAEFVFANSGPAVLLK